METKNTIDSHISVKITNVPSDCMIQLAYGIDNNPTVVKRHIKLNVCAPCENELVPAFFGKIIGVDVSKCELLIKPDDVKWVRELLSKAMDSLTVDIMSKPYGDITSDNIKSKIITGAVLNIPDEWKLVLSPSFPFDISLMNGKSNNMPSYDLSLMNKIPENTSEELKQIWTYDWECMPSHKAAEPFVREGAMLDDLENDEIMVHIIDNMIEHVKSRGWRKFTIKLEREDQP